MGLEESHRQEKRFLVKPFQGLDRQGRELAVGIGFVVHVGSLGRRPLPIAGR